MTTKLYLRASLASDVVAGTLPASEQSSATPDSDYGGDLLSLSSLIGTGLSVSAPLNSIASVATKKYAFRRFCSLPLASSYAVGASPIELSLAGIEGNLNANFALNSFNLYVWRPSTGAKVGTIIDMPITGSVSGALEPATAFNYYVMGSTLSAGLTPVLALAGDVIILEVWAKTTQSSAAVYSIGMSFDGGTENTTNGALIGANHASFIQFSEDLTFESLIENGALAASGAGVLVAVGQYILQGVATFAAVGELNAAALNYVEGVASFAAAANSSVVGVAINESVAMFAGQSALAAVWDLSSVVLQGVASMEATSELAAVGLGYYPHIFLQEAAGADGWVKETAL